VVSEFFFAILTIMKVRYTLGMVVTLTILALGRQSQEDHKFGASLDYIASMRPAWAINKVLPQEKPSPNKSDTHIHGEILAKPLICLAIGHTLKLSCMFHSCTIANMLDSFNMQYDLTQSFIL
jgi:hypothetical protein